MTTPLELPFCCPVAARFEPLVFFNVMRVSERGSGDWVHVGRADLVRRNIEIILTPDELLLGTACAPEWPLRPWVSELVSVSDDARTLTCRVGVPDPRGGGGCAMRYWFFDLDVESGSLARLVDLRMPPEYE